MTQMNAKNVVGALVFEFGSSHRSINSKEEVLFKHIKILLDGEMEIVDERQTLRFAGDDVFECESSLGVRYGR